jgi:hypothetical protein
MLDCNDCSSCSNWYCDSPELPLTAETDMALLLTQRAPKDGEQKGDHTNGAVPPHPYS